MYKNTLNNGRIPMPLIAKFVQAMGIKPIHIILPTILSIAISILDGISFILLIPLIRGIITRNIYFVSDTPILKDIIAFVQKLKYVANVNFSAEQSIFVSLILVVLFTAILKNSLAYFSYLLSDYWYGKFNFNFSVFLLNRFLSFGKPFFDRVNKGYIVLVLSYSGTLMRLLNFLQDSITDIFTLIVSITIMCIVSWKLTLILFLLFSCLRFSLNSINNQLGKLSEKKHVAQIRIGEKISNILSCTNLIKAYSREKETVETYAHLREQMRKLNLRSAKIKNLIKPMQEISVVLFIVCCLTIALVVFQTHNHIKLSAFVVFFYVARRAIFKLDIFNKITLAIKKIKPELREVLEILDDNDKFFVVEGEKIFKGLTRSIDFRNLCFSYTEGGVVLKDLDFSVEKGKTTAIVGSSGAGKTTLINLIMRFYDCPPGSILIDGVDIRHFTLKSLRENIELVSQEVCLFNDTLRNNIAFGLDKRITDDQLMDIARKSRLQDCIMHLPNGFNTQIGDGGVKLSGGEKQMVGIARSLLKDSEILFLDEATSSLDSKTEKLIQEAIEEAVKGRTAIVIAHRLSTIRNADKIVVIEKGCFIEEGNLSELLRKKGKFYEYWEAQKFY